MKLTKLSSAVSVSLLAVALTACGGSNEANDPPVQVTTPEVNPSNNNANNGSNAQNQDAIKAEEAKKVEEAKKAEAAKIAALVTALQEAGLNQANATFIANSNPNVVIGSTAYNDLLAAKLEEQKKVDASANQGAAPTKTTSEVVVKANQFIKNVDTSKHATVTANQYSRQPGSNFDRRANPDQLGGLGEVGIDDPTEQNPYLSNYVLAVEAVNGKVVAIDSTGEFVEEVNGKGKRVDADKSPYVKNNGLTYVVNTQEGDKYYSYAADGDDLANKDTPYVDKTNQQDNLLADPAGAQVEFDLDEKAYTYTLQEVNSDNVKVDDAAAKEALAAAKNAKNGKFNPADVKGMMSGLVVYDADSIDVGNKDGIKLGYKVPSYGIEENIYNEDGVVLNAVQESPKGGPETGKNKVDFVANELVQYSAVDGNGTRIHVEKFKATNDKVAKNPVANGDRGAVVTEVGQNNQDVNEILKLGKTVANSYETRIFGKNYRDYEAGKEGFQKTDNTYEARFNSKGGLTNLAPTKLHHVQYGRLTNNIDVLANKTEKDEKVIVYRQFQQHGANNSVDTYFYRGTNKTTLEQMDAVKAKGGVITYNGHALTYGIGPKVGTEKVVLGIPTAFGLASGEATIGNFVQAKYDIAKSRVDGSVYNFINKSVNSDADKVKNSDFIKQDLVSFGGDVYGNTVTGTATKLGLGETGTFTGSFFGQDASELGGAISSIERSKGYAQPKWGAVFGATKGSNVDNFNVIEQKTPTQ